MTAGAVVTARGITRRFRSGPATITAVDDVSLTLVAGQVAALSGPSGAGKSTLLHIIVGWDRPDHGGVAREVGGAAGWAGVALVPQDLGLLEELTVAENVMLPALLSERAATAEVASLLQRLDLTDVADRLPGRVSMGEQQRAAIARAAVCSPRLLVADEPTAHQDEARAEVVMELLAAQASDGAAVLVATHDERALTRADVVLHMIDGRVGGPARPAAP